jgi:excinuclease ABC subunit B
MKPEKLLKEIDKLEKQMYEHARNLEFEEAALLRDRLEEIKQLTLGPAA